jgi:hypothetical protein
MVKSEHLSKQRPSKYILRQEMPYLVRLLTSADSRSKDVCVLSIIVPELEFCNIKRQILAADLVKAPDDAALEDRPEALKSATISC